MLQTDVVQAQSWADLRSQLDSERPDEFSKIILKEANYSRVQILRMIDSARLGHVGGDFSVIDILTTLFLSVLRVNPSDPLWEDRDRFILSKGHCAASFYTTLARSGFFDPAELLSFMKPLSMLNGHPSKGKVPGVETSTGALGHGLPVGVGAAIGAKLQNSSRKVYVVLGDGELQEGSNWEAAMSASHHQLDNLVAIIDRNGLQQGAPTEATNALESLSEKWSAFGWDVVVVNGHNPSEIYEATTMPHHHQPRCVIAKTIKGRGVSFMENDVAWHHKVPSPEQLSLALEELSR